MGCGRSDAAFSANGAGLGHRQVRCLRLCNGDGLDIAVRSGRAIPRLLDLNAVGSRNAGSYGNACVGNIIPGRSTVQAVLHAAGHIGQRTAVCACSSKGRCRRGFLCLSRSGLHILRSGAAVISRPCGIVCGNAHRNTRAEGQGAGGFTGIVTAAFTDAHAVANIAPTWFISARSRDGSSVNRNRSAACPLTAADACATLAASSCYRAAVDRNRAARAVVPAADACTITAAVCGNRAIINVYHAAISTADACAIFAACSCDIASVDIHRSGSSPVAPARANTGIPAACGSSQLARAANAACCVSSIDIQRIALFNVDTTSCKARAVQQDQVHCAGDFHARVYGNGAVSNVSLAIHPFLCIALDQDTGVGGNRPIVHLRAGAVVLTIVDGGSERIVALRFRISGESDGLRIPRIALYRNDPPRLRLCFVRVGIVFRMLFFIFDSAVNVLFT